MTQKLVKYQSWSVITKVITTGLSVIQGIIIVRILSPSEYGLIGIVLAVGGMIGVLEHFGLATGSIREISVTKKINEASKVLFTSLFVRLMISLPLATGLFFASDYISNNIYHHPEISFPLKLFSLVIVFRGGQDVFASSLNGLQKFKYLFSFQILSSIITLSIFVVLVKYKNFIGYFFAMLLVSLILSVILVIINFKIFKKEFVLPNVEEFKNIFKNIFKIGLVTYVVKILYIMWQKIGILIAGFFLLPKEIGYISFALFMGIKTTFFMEAVSGVNLPVMSKKYNESIEIFKKEFKENFSKVFIISFFGSIAIVFYSREIITLFVGQKYSPSFQLIPFLVLGCFLYSLINFNGASVILPALMLKEAIYYYIILCLVSCITTWFFLLADLGALAVAIGILSGAVAAFVLQNIFIYKKLKIWLFSIQLFYLVLCLVPLVIIYLLNPNQIIKGAFFITSLIVFFSLSKNLAIFNWKKMIRLEFLYK